MIDRNQKIQGYFRMMSCGKIRFTYQEDILLFLFKEKDPMTVVDFLKMYQEAEEKFSDDGLFYPFFDQKGEASYIFDEINFDKKKQEFKEGKEVISDSIAILYGFLSDQGNLKLLFSKFKEFILDLDSIEKEVCIDIINQEITFFYPPVVVKKL
jgi:hypothetical protein